MGAIDPTVITGAIAGLVQVFKQAGLPVRFSPLAAVGTGLVFGIAEQVKAQGSSLHDVGAFISSGEQGLLLGLAAVGLYTAASAVGAKVTAAKSDPAPAASPSK